MVLVVLQMRVYRFGWSCEMTVGWMVRGTSM